MAINGDWRHPLAEYLYVTESVRESRILSPPAGGPAFGLERCRVSTVRVTVALPANLRQKGRGP
jgi:hypothetical protein